MSSHLRSIVITGASSGIGAAIAEVYAEPNVSLWLNGRNMYRLNQVATRCRARGATVDAETIDVTDQLAMADWISRIDATTGLSLVIANAGISGDKNSTAIENEIEIRNIFAVNLIGVLNTILPAIPRMLETGHGQLGLMSSMAGFRGLPTATAYAASKSAILSFGDGLRGKLKDKGIKVSVICPGFVRSRITDRNTFPMPFFMEADQAARIIQIGLKYNRPRIVFPWRLRAAMWLISAIPAGWADIILKLARRNS